jgi:hypothetical protein
MILLHDFFMIKDERYKKFKIFGIFLKSYWFSNEGKAYKN